MEVSYCNMKMSRARSPKPYENVELPRHPRKNEKEADFINNNGVFRLQAYPNTTERAHNTDRSAKYVSSACRTYRTEYPSIEEPANEYFNFSPTCGNKPRQFRQAKSEAFYDPPHAMLDREASIGERNRQRQESKRMEQEEYLRTELQASYSGVPNAMSLVKSVYQVPVTITKKDGVISTKCPQRCNGYYELGKSDVLHRVYFHM